MLLKLRYVSMFFMYYWYWILVASSSDSLWPKSKVRDVSNNLFPSKTQHSGLTLSTLRTQTMKSTTSSKHCKVSRCFWRLLWLIKASRIIIHGLGRKTGLLNYRHSEEGRILPLRCGAVQSTACFISVERTSLTSQAMYDYINLSPLKKVWKYVMCEVWRLERVHT